MSCSFDLRPILLNFSRIDSFTCSHAKQMSALATAVKFESQLEPLFDFSAIMMTFFSFNRINHDFFGKKSINSNMVFLALFGDIDLVSGT